MTNEELKTIQEEMRGILGEQQRLMERYVELERLIRDLASSLFVSNASARELAMFIHAEEKA